MEQAAPLRGDSRASGHQPTWGDLVRPQEEDQLLTCCPCATGFKELAYDTWSSPSVGALSS